MIRVDDAPCMPIRKVQPAFRSEDFALPGSKLLKIATLAVACPLGLWFLVALRLGGIERAILIGFCVAPTAITWHFAQWMERVERTVRIRFMPADRGVLLGTRAAVAFSLLALAWAVGAALVSPLVFDLRIAALVLGPVIGSLFLASRSIDSAVGRLENLAEAA